MSSKRDETRRLARESIARGDPTGWFEELYRRASGSWDRVPWADLAVNPHLAEWLSKPPKAARSELKASEGGPPQDLPPMAARSEPKASEGGPPQDLPPKAARSEPKASEGGKACLVVGCGLGDDAEALSAAGFRVVAFDISPTAIEACRARFPASQVEYTVADLLSPPPAWTGRFDRSRPARDSRSP